MPVKVIAGSFVQHASLVVVRFHVVRARSYLWLRMKAHHGCSLSVCQGSNQRIWEGLGGWSLAEIVGAPARENQLGETYSCQIVCPIGPYVLFLRYSIILTPSPRPSTPQAVSLRSESQFFLWFIMIYHFSRRHPPIVSFSEGKLRFEVFTCDFGSMLNSVLDACWRANLLQGPKVEISSQDRLLMKVKHRNILLSIGLLQSQEHET